MDLMSGDRSLETVQAGRLRVAATAVAVSVSVLCAAVWMVARGGPPTASVPVAAEHVTERILSVNVTSDEILLAVAPDHLIGLSVLADDPDSSNAVREAATVPKRVTTDIEQILMLAPDLIVIGAHSADVARQAEGLGMRVFRIQGFESIDWIASLIRTLGAAAGASDRAERIVAEMADRIEAVRARVAGQTRPRVLLYSESGWVGGNRTTLDDVIRAAGGVNVAAELGITGWRKVSPEQIVMADPEVIILRDARRWESGFRQRLLEDPAFQSVSALREHRVYSVPARLPITSSQHIADTVETVARLLHPELFREPAS
jgi:iron complex transport system substrate-binding protein